MAVVELREGRLISAGHEGDQLGIALGVVESLGHDATVSHRFLARFACPARRAT